MDFLPHYDKIRCAAFAEKIKRNTNDWQMIEVGVTGSLNAAHIAYKMCVHFKGKDGITLICNRKTVLVLVSLGRNANLQVAAMTIQEKMPPQSCTVVASGLTGDGLARLQLHIHETCANEENNRLSTQAERMERQEHVVMVVEDDMFIRSLIAKTLKPHAHIIELASAENVVDAYLEHLPDVVFLDIHLPGGSGLDALKEILNFDGTAHIVITTSDAAKENVMNAVNSGAKGFIAKTFTPDKLLEAYNKCPTVAARAKKDG